MTVALNIVNVITAIAGLTPVTVTSPSSSITIKGLDGIPVSAQMITPILFPDPDEMVADFEIERNSQGSGAVAKWTVRYTLNYLYLHSEIGSSDIMDIYTGFLANVAAILDKIITNDSVNGAVDLVPQRIVHFGTLTDPAGVQYFGSRLNFKVMEFQN